MSLTPRTSHILALLNGTQAEREIYLNSMSSLIRKLNTITQLAPIVRCFNQALESFYKSNEAFHLEKAIAIFELIQVELIQESQVKSLSLHVRAPVSGVQLNIYLNTNECFKSLNLVEGDSAFLQNDQGSSYPFQLDTVLKFTLVNNKILVQEAKESNNTCFLKDSFIIRAGQYYFVNGLILSSKINKKGELEFTYKNDEDDPEKKILTKNYYCYLKPNEESKITFYPKIIDNFDGELTKIDRGWEMKCSKLNIGRFLHTKDTSSKTFSTPLLVTDGMVFAIGGNYIRMSREPN